MKIRNTFSKFWPLLILGLGLCWLSESMKAQHKRTTAPKQATLVAQAIVDEIYDYDRQGDFEFVGEADGDKRNVVMYIEPETRERVGKVIYKYMPFGEVIRSYTIDSATGLATLQGDPGLEFPFRATQPNTRTVYLDDAYVCKLKSTWERDSFVISLKPEPSQLDDAARRQIKRVGYSVRLSSQRPTHSK